jgi:hypothetical protein
MGNKLLMIRIVLDGCHKCIVVLGFNPLVVNTAANATKQFRLGTWSS